MDDLDLGATIKGFSPGQKAFRRYTLQKILGRGGMGVVWLARDEELERDVALKFLPEVVAMDKQAILELKRETRRSLELTHPHIIRIYDFVQDGRTAAISMEYVAGDTLAGLKVEQAHQCFPVAGLARWVRQLCEALDYAHGKAQVVHRDLKPANLMVDARGDLKIADFGIAASVSDSVSRVSAQTGSSGTPVYMSPQQMMGDKPAVTDDIYSLGATLYDLLTGKPPFHSGNILMQVQSKVPAPLGERTAEFGAERIVPPEWEATIAACLAKDPAERPRTSREVAQRLGLIGAVTAAPFAPVKPAAAAPAPTPVALPVAPAPVAPPAPKRPLPKSVLWGALAAVVIVAAGLGWYFGVHVPAQAKAAVEAARVAEERELTRAVEAVRILLGRSEWAAAEAAIAVLERTARAKPAGWAGQWESAVAELKAALRDGRETARLAAVRIPVTLRTLPAGAELFVGGQSRGVAPVAGLPLPLGEHKVVARLAQHDDLEFTLQVSEKGQTEWTLPLVRSSGSLTVASVPADASFEVYGVNPNGEAAKEPLKQGILPAAALTLPTGEYEVLVASRREGSDVFVRQRVAVRRGETAAVQADVRGATLEVTSTPSGATVALDGETLGVTPLKRDGLTYGLLGQVTVTAPGFKSASRAIQFKGADEPQTWDVTLEPLPNLLVRPDFTAGPRRVQVRLEGRVQSSGAMTTDGQTTPIAPTNTTTRMTSDYALSGPDGQGNWTRALSDVREVTPTNPYEPGTQVAFERDGAGWRGRFARGGFVVPSLSADLLSVSYPTLWFDAQALPAVSAEVGQSWPVPASSWNLLLAGWRLESPRGWMRGTVRQVGGSGDEAWAEVEYRFEIGGTQRPLGVEATSSTLEAQGTLVARIELARRFISRVVLEAKMRVGMTLGLAAGSSRTLTKVEANSRSEFTVTPLDGPALPEAEAANVPVRFYRRNNLLVGIAVQLGVERDGQELVLLSDGTYQEVQLPPGRHSVRTVVISQGKRFNETDTVFDVVPGGTNHYELIVGMGKPIRIEPRSADVAAAAMRGLKNSRGRP